MYDKNHYNIVISLQLIKINGEKKDKFIAMNTRVEVPQKIKNRTIIWSSYSTSGYLCKKKIPD